MSAVAVASGSHRRQSGNQLNGAFNGGNRRFSGGPYSRHEYSLLNGQQRSYLELPSQMIVNGSVWDDRFPASYAGLRSSDSNKNS